MRLKIISCEVLFREVCLCAAHSKNIVDVEFMTKGLHDNPDAMRTELQRRIDSSLEDDKYEAIALGYGLCCNGTEGLIVKDKTLVIPRAHDCITLFLGSKGRYNEHFSKYPGTYYYTTGWMERGGAQMERTQAMGKGLGKTYQEYVEKYGEENAKYLMEIEGKWKTNYTRGAFIEMELAKFLNYDKEAQKISAENNWGYEEIKGDMRIIKKLVEGEWDEEEFLVLKPGERVRATYDSKIITSHPVQTEAVEA